MTTWWPDTCGCVIEVDHKGYEYDDPRVIGTPITKCSAHRALADKDVFATVYHKENKLKNQICGLIQKNHPELVSKDPSISCPYMGPYGLNGTLIFNNNRKIVVTIDGLSAATKSAIDVLKAG